MARSPGEVVRELRRLARERHDAERSDKTRVVVQVGHCSQSVGAASVAATLAASLPEDAYQVVAGCDGACFAGTQVAVTGPDGAATRHTGVTRDGAKRLADDIGASSHGDRTPEAYLALQRRIAMAGCGEMDSMSLGDYLLAGGYLGAARALEMTPEEVIEQVKSSGLRGRGGAYFPAALKWESARRIDSPARHLVVNAEEGEPGVFKDRHLMEGAPHRIIEGALVAAYASGASKAHIYINAEADLSAERMASAVGDASDEGLLGKNILGSGFDLNVSIHRGAGGYVCGEETTLLNTMEGDRREPRLRPPFPTEAGLHGLPTVINNPETLSSVPFIMTRGAETFASIGREDAAGTKIISLSGSVCRPGVAEVSMGATLREVVMEVGGGAPAGRELAAIAVGGPSSGVLPPSMLDTPIGPGLLHDSGVMLGAGGVIAIDERAGALDVVRRLAAYNAAESCGKCTPCREGTPRMVDAIDRLMSGDGSAADIDELRYLAEVVGAASLCGLGQAAGGPVNSALHFFGDQVAALAGVD